MHQMESVSQSQPAVARDNRAVQMMLQWCSHHIVAACVAAKCFCQIATWGNFIWSWSPRLWPDAVPQSVWENITFKSKENGNEPFQFCYIYRNLIKIQIYILGQIKSEINDQWLSFVALSIFYLHNKLVQESCAFKRNIGKQELTLTLFAVCFLTLRWL